MWIDTAESARAQHAETSVSQNHVEVNTGGDKPANRRELRGKTRSPRTKQRTRQEPTTQWTRKRKIKPNKGTKRELKRTRNELTEKLNTRGKGGMN